MKQNLHAKFLARYHFLTGLYSFIIILWKMRGDKKGEGSLGSSYEMLEFFRWLRKYGGKKFTERAKQNLKKGLPTERNVEKLKEVKRIIIHSSGFTAGNVKLLRLYHKIVNKWADIGYHFVIGNGVGGYSVDGQLEAGRDLNLQEAHAKGYNQNSIGICVISSKDFFLRTPPSSLQYLALENLLFFLCRRFNVPPQNIITHSSISPKKCPGPAFNLEFIKRKVVKRLKKWTWKKHLITYDIRRLLKVYRDEVLNNFDYFIKIWKIAGITRILVPSQWNLDNKKVVKEIVNLVSVLKENGFAAFLYFGPFGTERVDTLKKYPFLREWEQMNKKGDIISYGGLPFFCPNSPYLLDFKMPQLKHIINISKSDGVFLDIPWFLKDC